MGARCNSLLPKIFAKIYPCLCLNICCGEKILLASMVLGMSMSLFSNVARHINAGVPSTCRARSILPLQQIFQTNTKLERWIRKLRIKQESRTSTHLHHNCSGFLKISEDFSSLLTNFTIEEALSKNPKMH